MELIRKNWWVLALQGLFLFAVGALVLLETFLLAEVLNFLGLVFVVFGVLMLIWGIRSRKSSGNWWGLTFFGLIQAALGTLVLVYPSEASEIFDITIGSFAIIIGLAQFILGIGRKANRLMFFANGLVSAVVGVLIIFDPFESEEAVPFLVALFSAILGIFIIYYSVKLRNYANALAQQKREKRLKADEEKRRKAQQDEAPAQNKDDQGKGNNSESGETEKPKN